MERFVHQAFVARQSIDYFRVIRLCALIIYVNLSLYMTFGSLQ